MRVLTVSRYALKSGAKSSATVLIAITTQELLQGAPGWMKYAMGMTSEFVVG